MNMAQTFEPMRVLHDQVAQLSDSFQEHLGLVRALEPAKKFRDRILWLADTFNQAEKLQAEFSQFALRFDGSEAEASATTTSRKRTARAIAQPEPS